MKIAVAGHNTQVGKELIKRGCVPFDCSVDSGSSIQFELSQVKPDIIIYTYPISESKEWHDKNNAESYKVNVRGPANIIDHFDGIFVYLSSVHVFSGKKFFDYTEGHKPDPESSLGFIQWGGELATEVSSFLCSRTFIIRTSELFNREILDKEIEDMMNGKDREKSESEKHSFLYIPHFVNGLLYILEDVERFPDLIHLAGEYTMSKYLFWHLLAQEMKLPNGTISNKKTGTFNGGLSVKLAKSLGVPIYKVGEGIKEMLKHES